jgi:hypothetical protein
MKAKLISIVTKLSLIFLVSPATGYCNTIAGDTIVFMDEVIVTSNRNNSNVKTDSLGATIISNDLLRRAPKIMGNADPLRIIQSLPGVHTNSEYDSGIRINGDEASQTAITLDGVPIFGVSHLLGFFSIFNPSHFSSVTLQRNSYVPSSNQRIGAEINFSNNNYLNQNEDIIVEGTIGMMSSQGTIRMKTSPGSLLILSARQSYLNLLYGKLLEMDDLSLRYGFGDYNLSYISKISDRDKLMVNFYTGNDNADIKEYNYQAVAHIKWDNLLTSVNWDHKTDNSLISNKLFITRYRSSLFVDEEIMGAQLKSSIVNTGYTGHLSTGNISFSTNWNRYYIIPQTPNVIGATYNADRSTSTSNIITLDGSYKLKISKSIIAESGLQLSSFYSKMRKEHAIDPFVSLRYRNASFGNIDLSFGRSSQYLWQTGFSNSGFPTEFWISSLEANSKPQSAWGGDFMYSKSFSDDMFQLEIRGFYKLIDHQIEYKGDMLDLLNSYSIFDHLLFGKGYNMGLSGMLQKQGGELTGWISYSWQRLRRTFSTSLGTETSAANHERPHEINAFASYRINRHWDFAANFVFASGTPFTIVEEMYLINGAIVTQFGQHNNARLPNYFRIDVSANYDFNTSKSFSHGINFSLYNLTASSNALFYIVHSRKHNTEIVYKPLTFALPIMPSVSYYFKF